MKKVVVYSHDTFGLGNVRRMLAIIQYLLDQADDLSILLISGSPFLHQLELPKRRFDYLKLPCLCRDEQGTYGVKTLGAEFNELVAMRSQAIKSIILKFRPAVILVDKKPTGVAGELLPTLQSIKQHHWETQWVLLLRDILDNPATTKRIWDKNAYHSMIEEYYRKILVVGSKAIYDIRKEYDFPSTIADKVVFCGYTNRAEIEHGKTASQRLNGKKFVLVTPGGGEDGFRLIDNYIQGLMALEKPTDFKSLIVTGPEMADNLRMKVKEMSATLSDVEIKTYTSNLINFMKSANLVVSMAGYNTLCEIVSLGKPAIVVPRIKPAEEQWIRAKRFARQGLITHIHPDKLTPSRLINTVRAELDCPAGDRLTARSLNFNGLANVSRIIGDLLNSPTHYHRVEPLSVDIRVLSVPAFSASG